MLQHAEGGLQECPSSISEADAASQVVSVTNPSEVARTDGWRGDILQIVCASGPQVPDFAALLPDGYDWDAYVKQHFCKLLQQVWQAQNEVSIS